MATFESPWLPKCLSTFSVHRVIQLWSTVQPPHSPIHCTFRSSFITGPITVVISRHGNFIICRNNSTVIAMHISPKRVHFRVALLLYSATLLLPFHLLCKQSVKWKIYIKTMFQLIELRTLIAKSNLMNGIDYNNNNVNINSAIETIVTARTV